MQKTIKQLIQDSIDSKQHILENEYILSTISQLIGVIVAAFKNENSVYFCGNGGSAVDAQHLAA